MTETALLADLLPRVGGLQRATGDEFAILDDLVPGTNSKVPVERTVARLVKLDGLGLFQDYNPFVFTMREVLNAPVPADAEERDRWVRPGLESIPLERDDARLIRSVNYLWRGWQPPRSFSGALLWPEHWEQLKHY